MKVPTRLIVDPTVKSKFCSVSVPGGNIPVGKSASITVNCHFTHDGYAQTESARVLIQNNKYQEVANLRISAKTIENRCPSVDLNPSAPLKNMPVLDQDGTGMCYAFSASTLIEYELKKKGHKTNLSPIDAGLVYKTNADLFDTQLDGGHVDDTIRALMVSGVASRECVDKVIKDVTKTTGMTSEEFTALMQNIKLLEKADSKVEKAHAQAELDEFCRDYNIAPDVVTALKKNLDGSIRKYFFELLEPCRKERNNVRKWNLGDYDHRNYGSNKKLQGKINEVMRDKRPVAVGICAEIVTEGNPKHQGLNSGYWRSSKTVDMIEKTVTTVVETSPGKKVTTKTTTIKRIPTKNCSPHAVVITGQKKEKGVCQYLIRNSWGASWEGKGLVCACRTSKNYYADCSKAPKNESNKVVVGCWVPETTLLPNLMDAGGFKAN